jgi:hypothetical protein
MKKIYIRSIDSKKNLLNTNLKFSLYWILWSMTTYSITRPLFLKKNMNYLSIVWNDFENCLFKCLFYIHNGKYCKVVAVSAEQCFKFNRISWHKTSKQSPSLLRSVITDVTLVIYNFSKCESGCLVASQTHKPKLPSPNYIAQNRKFLRNLTFALIIFKFQLIQRREKEMLSYIFTLQSCIIRKMLII